MWWSEPGAEITRHATNVHSLAPDEPDKTALPPSGDTAVGRDNTVKSTLTIAMGINIARVESNDSHKHLNTEVM